MDSPSSPSSLPLSQPPPPDHDSKEFQTPAPSSSAVPIPKIEDSTVYNYINNFSPIEPVNSTHGGQSYQLLGSALPQSSVVLPPASCPKPSEILSVSSVSNQSKPETSDIGSEGNKDEVTLETGEVNHIKSAGEIISVAKNGLPKPAVEPVQSIKYGRVGPESDCNATEQGCGFERIGVEEECPVEVISDISKNSLSDSELELDQFFIEQTKETLGYDWDKLFSEAADLLTCYSPTKDDHLEGPYGPYDKSLDSGMASFIASASQFSHDNTENMLELQSLGPVTSSVGHSIQLPSTQPQVDEKAEASCQGQPAHYNTIVAEKPLNDFSSEVHDKPCNQQQQMMRKHCLVFEVSGAHFSNVISDSSATSSMSEQYVSNIQVQTNTQNEKQRVIRKIRSTKASSLLPGIGLHLNVLAALTRDKIIVKQDVLTRKRQLISIPSAICSCRSSNTKALSIELAPDHMEHENNRSNTDLQLNENVFQSSAIGDCEALNHSSPRKKRPKTENAGEADGCKRCCCKRSKCLKLYCECFAAGLYCAESCSCRDCFNRPVFEETVLQTRRQIESRNPLAFAPKVIRVSDSSEHGDESCKTPASARHKSGCNCKKSNCLKRYCECFQGGVGCSPSCRCEGCRNFFGQKDGIEDPTVDEIESSGKGTTDASLDVAKDNTEVENQDSHVMPLRSCRRPITLPFRSGCLSQVCSVSSGLSPRSCTDQNLQKSSCPSDRHNGDTQLEMIPEDEAPDFLIDDTSPTTDIKPLSPNRKRISLIRESGSPLAWRSSRRLILKSIPSFPTLNALNEKEKLEGKS